MFLAVRCNKHDLAGKARSRAYSQCAANVGGRRSGAGRFAKTGGAGQMSGR